jgi:hypothetical protein
LRVQNVRFKSNPFGRRSTWWRIGAGLIFTYVASTRVAKFLVQHLELDDDDAENLAEPMELSDDEMQDQLDNARFFPLTWATKLPRTYYDGNDPEWQEFIRIAKDKETREKIKEDAMMMVSNGAVRSPVISTWIGQNPRFGRSWIEFHFPYGPPEAYARDGIFWADDFIATGTQEMTHEEYQQWMRSIWPVAVGKSAWAAVKVLVGMQIRRIGQATGYAQVNPSSPEEKYKLWRKLVQHQDAMRAAKGQAGKTPTPPQGEAGSTNTSASISSNDSPAKPSRTSEFSLTDPRLLSWLISDISKPPGPPSSSTSNPVSPIEPSDPSANSFSNLDLPVAMLVFRQTFQTLAAAQLRDYRDIPRGDFLVQGLVEMMGSNGRVQFDFSSVYDPAEKRFVNAIIRVRGHYPRLQAPKGGNGPVV